VPAASFALQFFQAQVGALFKHLKMAGVVGSEWQLQTQAVSPHASTTAGLLDHSDGSGLFRKLAAHLIHVAGQKLLRQLICRAFAPSAPRNTAW
jgi:hypothetical protein